MTKYYIGRLVQMLLTLLVISIIVFGLSRLTGDPVEMMAGPWATAEDLTRIRARLGLDSPIVAQYARYIGRAVQGDFGESIRWHSDVMGIILDRFPNSLLLSMCAMVFAFGFGLPLGVISAVYRGRFFDTIAKFVALVGQSMPSFWIGILLIMAFALYVPLFPTSGIGTASHFVLPSITLGWFVAANIMRVTRSAVLDVLDSDYVRTARARGFPERTVIWDHALRNAAIPIVTVTALQAANILQGAVVTETVFAWPGLGKLAVDAVFARDFPVVQGAVLFGGLIYISVNLALDVLYGYLDPRISYKQK
jgi:peptide/nickel transport system permease protein